jgi:DNA-binding HxlR family transcriptional regulator
MIGGISQRMLTLTLRGLERDGLVKRTQFPTIPPRVDYELTQLGLSLWEAVKPLGAWAQGHVKHITRARATFDKKIKA